jgi:hypothetical protein
MLKKVTEEIKKQRRMINKNNHMTRQLKRVDRSAIALRNRED